MNVFKELLTIIFFIAVGFLVAICIKEYVGQGNNVVGESMEPTLHSGDYFLTERITKNYKKDDIVVIKMTDKSIVKRIIATEGETVKIQDGELYINGKIVEEDYIKEKANADYPEVQVPKGTVFVLGDNRNNSSDSRVYKAFKLDAIQGKLWRVVDGFKLKTVD